MPAIPTLTSRARQKPMSLSSGNHSTGDTWGSTATRGPTTPRLQAESGLLVFTQAYAPHTYTGETLPRALTTANAINGQKYQTSYSLLDIFRNAEIETFWITNHVLYGEFDNRVTAIAKQADHLWGHNYNVGAHIDNRNYDEVLLPRIDAVINEQPPHNRVIFVHLYGNHKNYCKRYPPQYKRFQGKLNRDVYGNFAQRISYYKKINCYDNSVLYQDFIVVSILKMLKKGKGVRGFLFFSDHGVDVFKDAGQWAHKFTYDMAMIPMLAWFSEDYQQQYPQRYRALSNNKDKFFSNGFIYDTVIGLLNIQTKKYNEKYDLSSSTYGLHASDTKLLVGKRKYAHKENIQWQQKHNIQHLGKKKSTSRVIPHRVNSVAKLKEIWRDGYRAFEVDFYYNDNRDCFIVGHHQGVMSSLCLVDFLAHINTAEVTKIWLDVKAIRSKDIDKIIARLQYVSKVTGLREEFIFESGIKTPDPSAVQQCWLSHIVLSSHRIYHRCLSKKQPNRASGDS